MAAVAIPALQNACTVTVANRILGHDDHITCCGLKNSHAVLVVQGTRTNGAPFIGSYEVWGVVEAALTWSNSIQKALGNKQGTVGIRIREDAGVPNYLLNSFESSTVHRNVPAANLNAMLQSIYAQRNQTIPYQEAGAGRLSIWGGNGGHNCITWVKSKLAIAGLDNGTLPTDSSVTIPEAHTNKKAQLAIYGTLAALAGAVVYTATKK